MGDELGLTGVDGEHARTPYPWDRTRRAGTADLRRLREWIALRRDHVALRRGGLRWLHAAGDAMTFLREHPDQTLLVHATREQTSPVSLPRIALGPAVTSLDPLVGPPAVARRHRRDAARRRAGRRGLRRRRPVSDPRETMLAAGYDVGEVLGSGMEGTVAVLDDDRVVKLWDRRTRADVDRLRSFYDAVARAAGFALAVPRILEVVRGRTAVVVTVQVRLHGSAPTGSAAAPAATRLVVDVLAALAEVEVHPDMAVLPVPDGEPPFDPAVPFTTSLADLVGASRRARWSATSTELSSTASPPTCARLPPAPPALVHGDLGAGNLLVVDGRPSGLLDFGYVSTVGDAGVRRCRRRRAARHARPRRCRRHGGDRPAHDRAVRVRRAPAGRRTARRTGSSPRAAWSTTRSAQHFLWCLGLLVVTHRRSSCWARWAQARRRSQR